MSQIKESAKECSTNWFMWHAKEKPRHSKRFRHWKPTEGDLAVLFVLILIFRNDVILL